MTTLNIHAQPSSDLRSKISTLPSWKLSPRQLCDIEVILNGGFAPLQGFMNQADYFNVLDKMRLSDGTVWPIPIVLDVSQAFANELSMGSEIALRDTEGTVLALMQIENCWIPDKRQEAELVYGTMDPSHPGVSYLFNQSEKVYLGGKLTKIALPAHYDFPELRHTPTQLKAIFAEKKWTSVVGFQTRNPMHRAHYALTRYAMESCNAKLLIHPVVGLTKPGDINALTRVQCYKKILKHYSTDECYLSLLPLAMRMAGPREALWHAIIRQNYGCSHFIIGRDHASPGNDANGNPFYDPYAAQELVASHQTELNINMIPSQELVYVPTKKDYFPLNQVSDLENIERISGTEFRQRLRNGDEIPEWFSFPDVIETLKHSYPPLHQQGFTLLLTGLPSSGKSTLGKTLQAQLQLRTHRPVTLLDGDIIRNRLSPNLGFSKQERAQHLKRMTFVAEEITKHGGIAICAAIAPYQSIRQQIKTVISNNGGFIEVYIATPLSVCEERDPKGLYAKARAGTLQQFTGVSDPYEVPNNPDLTINTATFTPSQAAQAVLNYLEKVGYLNCYRQ